MKKILNSTSIALLVSSIGLTSVAFVSIMGIAPLLSGDTSMSLIGISTALIGGSQAIDKFA